MRVAAFQMPPVLDDARAATAAIAAAVSWAAGQDADLAVFPTAIVSPDGEVRARVPEGAAGRIVLDVSRSA